MTQYETVIGMEVHVELNTRTKVWCGCQLDAKAAPNTKTCPVCTGMPGVLPVLNREAVAKTLRICLAMNAQINTPCHFERKNYFYPDLPKAYQISQQARPLGIGGGLEILTANGPKLIRMDNVHLEEDAGKNFHPETAHADYTLVDLNRAGTPLVEIVSAPDLRSADEAEAYMKTLRNLLLYLDVSDCKMQEGSIRFEANISIRPKGSDKFGTKVEVKNLNSITTALKCIAYEEWRQAQVLDEGGKIDQETRLWDDAAKCTRTMRSKEDANDYRYFPDPDLVTVELSTAEIEKSRATLPELPVARQRRFESQFGLPAQDGVVLTGDIALADYFEAAVRQHNNPKAISNWIQTEILRYINENGGEEFDFATLPVSATNLAAMVALIDGGKISGKIAKTVIAEMLATGKAPAQIVAEQGLEVINDSSELEGHCKAAIEAVPAAAADVRAGKMKAIGRLVGEVMKRSQGKADPAQVNEILMRLLQP